MSAAEDLVLEPTAPPEPTTRERIAQLRADCQAAIDRRGADACVSITLDRDPPPRGVREVRLGGRHGGPLGLVLAVNEERGAVVAVFSAAAVVNWLNERNLGGY